MELMSSGPLVTFVLFTYNQEQFIREAVTAALAQEYMPLEIIISDDCSTDRTFDIIEELNKEYFGPHKVIINKNEINIGLSSHVNKVCIDFAHGDWLMFAAGDDISLPCRVKKTLNCIKNNKNAKGIHSAVCRVDEKGNVLNTIFPKNINITVIEKESMLGAAAAYHKDVFDIFGPMDREVQNEDMVLSLRALLLGEIVSFDEVCVLWRRHQGNMSGKINLSIRSQARFLYCQYQKKRLLSHFQQLKDLFFFTERYASESLSIIDLQLRLIKKIEKDCRLSLFASFFFDGISTPFSIKLNPAHWWNIFNYLAKEFIVSQLKHFSNVKNKFFQV